MNRMSGTRRITRALSDGSGLSQEEIVALASGLAAATALLGLLRTFDVLSNAWPGSHAPSVRRPT